MKIIAIEKELDGASAVRFKALAEAEAGMVWELLQKDFIRECYFRKDENSAVLVLESESVESAHAGLNELPFVKEGLIRFELLPLRPYPGFERLFK